MPNERILVVDDEVEIIHLCDRILTREGYVVRTAGGGREAIACLEAEPFDLLVVDIRMPDIDGLTVLRRGLELHPHIAVVVITGFATMDSAIRALQAGARGFVLKPFDRNELVLAVQEALIQRQQEQERLLMRAQLPILEIAQALAIEGDVDDLARQLLQAVVRELGVDRACLMLLDASGTDLAVAGAIGWPDESGRNPCLSAKTGVFERVLSGGELLVLEGEECQELYGSGASNGSDLATVVAIPLRTSGKAIGVFCLGRVLGSTPFISSDLNLLSIVGGQIATALENARLYEEIKGTRDYFGTMLDSLHDEVVVLDRDYCITAVNATFLRRMGGEREDVIGQPCYQIVHGCTSPCQSLEHPCPAEEVWRTGRPARSRHVHHNRLGKSYVDVTASPLYDAQGQISQVIEAYRDVTSEWRLQEDLAAIHALGRGLVLARDEEHIVQMVVEASERMLEFPICDLWLIDEDGKTLIRRACTAAESEIGITSFSMDSERSIVAAVAQSGETVYVPDARQDPRYTDIGLGMLSELCVPLEVGGRVLGVLNAESERLDAFDQNAQQLFSTLAAQAAMAIENARLYQIGEERTARLATLNTIGMAAVSSLDVDAILHQVLELTCHVLGADEGSILLVEAGTKDLVFVYTLGSDALCGQRLPQGQGIAGWVAEHGQAVCISDVHQDPRFYDGVDVVTGFQTRSLLYAPMRQRDEVIGVIGIVDKREGAFSDEDLSLLEAVAFIAATGLQNARLYTATQARADELALLNEIGLALASTLDFSQVVDAALRQIQQLFQAENVSLLQLDPQTGELYFVRALAGATPVEIPVRLQPGEGLAGWVLEQRRPVLVEDAQDDPRFSEQVDRYLGDQTRALMAVPLLTPDRAIGVIEVLSREPGVYAQEELHTLQSLASTLAVALENARLYEVVARGKQEWEETFDTIADGISIHDTDFRILRANWALAERLGTTPQALIGRHCYEVIHGASSPIPNCPCFEAMASARPKQIELEDANLGGVFQVQAYPLRDEGGHVRGIVHVLRDVTRHKRLEAELIRSEKLAALGRLLASLAHEINNPLQALRSGLRLLVNRQVEEEKRQKYLSVASREVERLIAIMERVLGFYRPSHERPAPTDVNAVLDETLTLAGKRLEHSGVTVRAELAPDLPQVEALADQLKQVFLNILLNAMQSMPEGGTLTVRTGRHRDWDEIYIAFTDTGVGIPQEMQARIFEPFSTTRPEGSGLGLSISYGIVERHGGRIEVESEVGAGSTFTILLPITAGTVEGRRVEE